MTPNMHDSGYKKLFSNRTIFRQLLETFVDEPWVRELDFDRAETLDKSFVSEHYKETESDLVVQAPLHDQTVYIYVLLEFQSTVDHFMALRMLNYLTNFYMDYVTSNPRIHELPPIFPILLYNGNRRWNAPVDITDLIPSSPLLGEYGLGFRYYKIAENEFTREALLRIRNIVSTLFLAEAHYDIDLLETELLALFEAEADKQAVSLFLNWFRQLALHGRIEPADYASLETVYRSTEEVKSMLVVALEKEREKARTEGLAEGREEGREEGRAAERREIARAMLYKGMDLALIAEVTGLTKAELNQLQAERNGASGRAAGSSADK